MDKQSHFFAHAQMVIELIHLPLVRHICVIIGPDNGLSPDPHQDITCTNAGLLSVVLLGTYLSEFKSEFYHFNSRKCNWKCRLPNWWPFCPKELHPLVSYCSIIGLLSEPYSLYIHTTFKPILKTRCWWVLSFTFSYLRLNEHLVWHVWAQYMTIT